MTGSDDATEAAPSSGEAACPALTGHNQSIKTTVQRYYPAVPCDRADFKVVIDESDNFATTRRTWMVEPDGQPQAFAVANTPARPAP